MDIGTTDVKKVRWILYKNIKKIPKCQLYPHSRLFLENACKFSVQNLQSSRLLCKNLDIEIY